MNNLIKQFEHDLVNQKHALKSVLPPGMELRRFMRTVSNLLQTHPQSQRLLAADRQSLFNACLKSAGDGLLLDGREAVLTVFHENKSNTDKVTYMPMVQGLVKLARNSNEISNIVAEVVYKNDGFIYRPGVQDQPLHDPDWFGDRGKPIGAYAVVTTKDNEKIVSVLARDRIIAIGQGGRNADQYMPGKGAHFVEWWKKTVIKNALKYSPKSTHLTSAMAADNELISLDKIPTTEKNVTHSETLKDILHGQSVTDRTETEQPAERSTLGQCIAYKQESSQDDAVNDQAEAMKQRVRENLRETGQVVDVAPTEEDKANLDMALQCLQSSKTLEQLDESAQAIKDVLHADHREQARVVYRQMKEVLAG